LALAGAGQEKTMSEMTYEAAPTADAQSVPRTATPIIHRIWPVAVIAFGLALTAAWMGLLGYALVKIIEMAI
jgi:hypothetical protein